MKILVCAPDRDLLGSLVRLLGLHGWETAAAHDGAGAVELIGSDRFDAALIDGSLPRVAATDVASLFEKTGAPAIIMTRNKEGKRSICYPFSPEELFTVLEGATGGKDPERSAKDE